MILDEFQLKQIKETFEAMWDNQESARALNGSASDLKKGLVQDLIKGDKKLKKEVNKYIGTLYKIHKDKKKGEETDWPEVLDTSQKIENV